LRLGVTRSCGETLVCPRRMWESTPVLHAGRAGFESSRGYRVVSLIVRVVCPCRVGLHGWHTSDIHAGSYAGKTLRQ